MNPESRKSHPIQVVLPGQTIGILGGGQLGRMIALEGRKMGYRFVVLDPLDDCPTGQVADEQVIGAYTDIAAAEQLAKKSDVITYEFENVDVAVAEVLETTSYVPQGSQLLRITQHRVLEKSTLQTHGVPVTPFAPVSTWEDFQVGIRTLGLPAVLKTSTGGYDGKGQWMLHVDTDLEDIWNQASVMASTMPQSPEHAQLAPLILEKFIDFDCEISTVVARNAGGEVSVFPVSENLHRHHILHLSIVPARIDRELEQRATELGKKIAETLQVVGLIAVEMFVTSHGELFVNELAPRPHNSGHYTYDACMTSQFEQHIRAICNLPLGPTTLCSPVVMVNVLGEHVAPLLEKIPSMPGNMKVHLYGKKEAKTKRKMGHVNVLASNVNLALDEIAALGIWSD